MKLFSCFVLPLVSSHVIANQQQRPIQSEEKEDLAPGLGIHLTASYATAALRYPNGTIEDVGKFPGNAEYIDLIARWAHLKEERKCIHQLEALMSFSCYVAQKIRHIRKWFGLPANGDIGTLSSLIFEAKLAAEHKLGSEITFVWPVFPYLDHLVQWGQYDIIDALEYAGLNFSTKMLVDETFWEPLGAYVGHGYGVCNSWDNSTRCEQEEHDIKPERVLFFNFDNSSFSAQSQWMRTAWRVWPDSHKLDLSLGWWDMPVHEVPRAKFWAKIQEVIVDVVSGTRRSDEVPNKIILLGEHADDEEFKETVKAAMWEAHELDVAMLLEGSKDVDGLMVGARGAAELAFRAQYRAGTEEKGGKQGSMHKEPTEL